MWESIRWASTRSPRSAVRLLEERDGSRMLTPLGKFVVAISRATGKIFVFAFNSSTGALALAPGSPVSTSSPYDLAIIQQ